MVVVAASEGLTWADSVPCEASESGLLEPKFNDSEALQICFLNEPKVRNARYEVLHYIVDGYYRDDGPPALDQIMAACRILDEALSPGKKVVVICPEGEAYESHRHFSALCVAAYPVVMKGSTADAAVEPWKKSGIGFLQNSWAPSNLPSPARALTLDTCLRSLELALKRGWFDKAFDAAAYRELNQKWDATWLIPGQLLLMADPVSTTLDPDPSTTSHLEPPESGDPSFVSFFESNGVKVLVRLNLDNESGLKKSYDPTVFKKAGMIHVQAAYDDVSGGLPRKDILKKILAGCVDGSSTPPCAFHCKAGFGRSGVCAAVLAIHMHDVPGELLLAWLRICRPGTITTKQQAEFLRGLSGRAALEKHLEGGSDSCCSIS